MNQPAHSRIIRFVFPDPVAPMMTWWRAHAAAGMAKTGLGLAPTTRIVPPIGMVRRRVSSGTEPGASVTPLAVRTCRRHCRLSKVTGAEDRRPPIPADTA